MSNDNKPTIEDDVPELDDNVPELEDAPTGQTLPPNFGGDLGSEDRKQSRAEKKARKAVAKLGLKQVTDIFRIAIKKSKGVIFVINDPEIYKAPNKDSYVVFGEAKVEDGLNKELERAASQFKVPSQTTTQTKENDEVPDLVTVEGGEENKDN